MNYQEDQQPHKPDPSAHYVKVSDPSKPSNKLLISIIVLCLFLAICIGAIIYFFILKTL